MSVSTVWSSKCAAACAQRSGWLLEKLEKIPKSLVMVVGSAVSSKIMLNTVAPTELQAKIVTVVATSVVTCLVVQVASKKLSQIMPTISAIGKLTKLAAIVTDALPAETIVFTANDIAAFRALRNKKTNL